MSGVWGSVDRSACVAHSCAEDGAWPMTPIGGAITLTCGLGQRGFRTRSCGAGGVWAEADESNCVQIVCYKDGAWPTTNALETAELPCPAGQLGALRRSCSAGGVWGEAENTCRGRECVA